MYRSLRFQSLAALMPSAGATITIEVRFFAGVISTRVATRVIKSPTENTMKRITLALLAGAAVLVAGPAVAQQNIDFSKVEVKTTDLGNKTYLLEGAGGNVTVAVGTDGIIMVDSQFAPMHDKLKAAIEKIVPDLGVDLVDIGGR